MEAVVIRFLTPFLGALLAGTQDAAESAASRLGSTALRRAQQLWVRLWPSIGADPRSRAAAQRLARSPGDAAAQRDLQAHVNRVLRADPELDRQVHLVVREAQNSGVMATDGGVVVMGNVSATGGGRVSIGNHVSAQGRGVAVVGDYHQQNTYADELAGSRGMALALQLIGLAIAMVGFAIAGRALFAWSHVSPNSAAANGFPPGFGLGFAIFGAGTVTAYVGRLLKR
jgi:hypothetical protein